MNCTDQDVVPETGHAAKDPTLAQRDHGEDPAHTILPYPTRNLGSIAALKELSPFGNSNALRRAKQLAAIATAEVPRKGAKALQGSGFHLRGLTRMPEGERAAALARHRHSTFVD